MTADSPAPYADAEAFDVLGPILLFITPPSDADDGYCVLKGTIPPGVVVPIHTHADRETFYMISGELQGWKGDRWHTLRAGDAFDVPGGARHAFRNASGDDATVLIVTTMALGRFFRQIGRPLETVVPGPPSAEAVQRFVQAALAAGHWLGGPEDNAAVGIFLPSPS